MKAPMPMPRWGVAAGVDVKAQYGSECRGKPLLGSLAVPTQLVGMLMALSLWLGGREVALEALPAFVVFVLQDFLLEGVAGGANGHAGFEHEG